MGKRWIAAMMVFLSAGARAGCGSDDNPGSSRGGKPGTGGGGTGGVGGSGGAGGGSGGATGGSGGTTPSGGGTSGTGGSSSCTGVPAPPQSGGTTYWVSPTGSDSNPG